MARRFLFLLLFCMNDVNGELLRVFLWIQMCVSYGCYDSLNSTKVDLISSFFFFDFLLFFICHIYIYSSSSSSPLLVSSPMLLLFFPLFVFRYEDGLFARSTFVLLLSLLLLLLILLFVWITFTCNRVFKYDRRQTIGTSSRIGLFYLFIWFFFAISFSRCCSSFAFLTRLHI